jgi:D-tyrosyl-tRNA(Tyr) deacylase
MRAVLQRTSRAAVSVDGTIVGAIGRGLLVLLGVGPDDNETTADRLASRVATVRIFPDAEGRMNLDVAGAGGALLVVSQFTLLADTSRGHRPSFIRAAPPELGERLYRRFADRLGDTGLPVATGLFGAHMEVDLVNDGPVTLVLTSGEGPWPADAG